MVGNCWCTQSILMSKRMMPEYYFWLRKPYIKSWQFNAFAFINLPFLLKLRDCRNFTLPCWGSHYQEDFQTEVFLQMLGVGGKLESQSCPSHSCYTQSEKWSERFTTCSHQTENFFIVFFITFFIITMKSLIFEVLRVKRIWTNHKRWKAKRDWW